MISSQSESVAERAKVIYRERLQQMLEAESRGLFVAIEPDSGEHFLAPSFSQAVAAARTAFPDRLAFVIRIGYDAAIHIGGIAS